MGAIEGTAMSVMKSVRPQTLSPVFVVAFTSLLVPCGGSLALEFCLSDPRVAQVRCSGFVRGSETAVLRVAMMSVIVCPPGGRSLGGAVGFVFSTPQGTIKS